MKLSVIRTPAKEGDIASMLINLTSEMFTEIKSGWNKKKSLYI